VSCSTLKDLIEISSVSAESNLPVIRYARHRLEQSGWHCVEQPYADEHGTAKANLIATMDQEQEPALALVCHTDTVPYDSPSLVQPVERDGKIFGRGACDVKGFLACALEAIGTARNMALVLTADEEIGCIGARRFVESQILRPRYAIIGEPTSLTPIRAGKGYCLAELRCAGREAHSAFSDLGESAIGKAARVVLASEQIQEQLKADRDESFDPPYTTLNIGVIQGGRAKNIIPGECTMLFEWRPIPHQTVDLAIEQLSGCEVKVLRRQPGFATSASSVIVTTLAELSGRAPATVSFGTEAPWIAQLGTECVVFGPGTMHVAHGKDEHVPIDELERCAAILREAIASACHASTE
jgi:acetylornithine deacetylase